MWSKGPRGQTQTSAGRACGDTHTPPPGSTPKCIHRKGPRSTRLMTPNTTEPVFRKFCHPMSRELTGLQGPSDKVRRRKQGPGPSLLTAGGTEAERTFLHLHNCAPGSWLKMRRLSAQNAQLHVTGDSVRLLSWVTVWRSHHGGHGKRASELSSHRGHRPWQWTTTRTWTPTVHSP